MCRHGALGKGPCVVVSTMESVEARISWLHSLDLGCSEVVLSDGSHQNFVGALESVCCVPFDIGEKSG